LVAGRRLMPSPRRGGSEREKASERWKGEVSSPSKLTWGRSDDIKQVSFQEIRQMAAWRLRK
jgi:hypothetical protein